MQRRPKHNLQPTQLEIDYVRAIGSSAFHRGTLYTNCPYDKDLQIELKLAWSEGYNSARIQTIIAERKI